MITNKIAEKDDNTIDALIILDIDFFKEINDNLGHYAGNLVLKDLAKGLKLIFRKEDVIGRIGGDEFCVYMQDISSAQFIKDKCSRLNNFIKGTNNDKEVSLSIGIALLNEREPYYKIFQMADHALYQAKNKGKNQSVIFNENKIDKENIEFI